MNKITIGNEGYEVLPLDRISEITHAKLAGGKVVKSEEFDCDVITLCSPAGYVSTRFGVDELEPFGIQPLKLIERKPVEFVASFAFSGSVWYPLHCLDDGLSMQGREQKVFRCVEVTK